MRESGLPGIFTSELKFESWTSQLTAHTVLHDPKMFTQKHPIALNGNALKEACSGLQPCSAIITIPTEFSGIHSRVSGLGLQP